MSDTIAEPSRSALVGDLPQIGLVVPWVLYTVDDSSNPSGLIASGIAENVPMAAALVASAVRCKMDELI